VRRGAVARGSWEIGGSREGGAQRRGKGGGG
jgi:hypothetical protein